MSEQLLALFTRAQLDEGERTRLLRAGPGELSALGLVPKQQAVLLSNLWLRRPFELEELPDWDARYGSAFPWLDNRAKPVPWTPLGVPLARARIALVTTAGIHRVQDPPFAIHDEEHGDPSYRIIPRETPPEDLRVCHHLALVRPDEQGAVDHLLPLDAAQALQQEGAFGALASVHYSFMGYIPHTSPLVAQTAPEMAARLNAERVDGAILIPV